jgi:two-component system sensor histidine kinase UhpB
MVMAQRQRTRLRIEQTLLVARAHEEERAWVASELHDDVLQRVALVRAEVESLWMADRPRTAAGIEENLRGINAELVDLAIAVRRIAARLHPTLVDQIGLVAALQALVDEIERGSDVVVQLTTDGAESAVSREAARATYRIAQESLRNIVRHAASQTARVSLRIAHDALTLRVEDDGRGFDPAVVRPGSLGLASLRERALIAGGSAEVYSRLGHGTTVEVRLPLGNV